jgi:hypothetical protein
MCTMDGWMNISMTKITIRRSCTSTSLYVVPDVIIYKARSGCAITLVSTLRQTKCVSVVQASWVRKTGALCCANHKKYTNTLCGKTCGVWYRSSYTAKPIDLPLCDGGLKTVTSQDHGRVQHWSDVEASMCQPHDVKIHSIDCFFFPLVLWKTAPWFSLSVLLIVLYVRPSVTTYSPELVLNFLIGFPQFFSNLLYVFPSSFTQASPYWEADSSSTNWQMLINLSDPPVSYSV